MNPTTEDLNKVFKFNDLHEKLLIPTLNNKKIKYYGTDFLHNSIFYDKEWIIMNPNIDYLEQLSGVTDEKKLNILKFYYIL